MPGSRNWHLTRLTQSLRVNFYEENLKTEGIEIKKNTTERIIVTRQRNFIQKLCDYINKIGIKMKKKTNT